MLSVKGGGGMAAGALSDIDVSSAGLITAQVEKSGHLKSGTKKTKQLTTQAAKTVTPGTSEQTAVAAGVFTTGAVKVAAMAAGALSDIAVSAAGLITAQVGTSGYLASGTKKTKQLTVQAAKTVTPGASEQTAVAAGVFTTGAVKVAGDADLIAENIREGISIFGVAGTLKEGVSISGMGCTAYAIDTITVSSDTELILADLPHSLGDFPQFMMLRTSEDITENDYVKAVSICFGDMHNNPYNSDYTKVYGYGGVEYYGGSSSPGSVKYIYTNATVSDVNISGGEGYEYMLKAGVTYEMITMK